MARGSFPEGPRVCLSDRPGPAKCLASPGMILSIFGTTSMYKCICDIYIYIHTYVYICR